jgi:hypothetical protein
MLPLSLLRDLAPLERFSAFKITVVLFIVVIVIFLFLNLSGEIDNDTGFVEHWIVIRGGAFERYAFILTCDDRPFDESMQTDGTTTSHIGLLAVSQFGHLCVCIRGTAYDSSCIQILAAKLSRHGNLSQNDVTGHNVGNNDISGFRPFCLHDFLGRHIK